MNCRVCDSDELKVVLDMGHQFLSDFREDNVQGAKYPLCLMRCNKCFTAQLKELTPPSEMYHDRYSFKSGVNQAIKDNLKEVVDHGLELHPDPIRNWLDIASNDGSLLEHVPTYIWRIGIDPLQQFAHEALTKADNIIVDFFDIEYFKGAKIDVVTSVSMFYDIPDPVKFAKDVASILEEDGIWIIQQNYYVDMVRLSSVDNISHEHTAYHSLASMKYILDQAGLQIVDFGTSPVNGGCFRIAVDRGYRKPTPKVRRAFDDEYHTFWGCIDQHEGQFAVNALMLRQRLPEMIDYILERNQKVYVYGASTRGGTIWQWAGIDHADTPYVVDRNPDKVGKYMTSIGAKIISEDEMRKNPPDYLLVGPWWFRDQFVDREQEFLNNGGKMIFPLPSVEVVCAS